MKYIPRLAESSLRHHLERGKSVLLLGPRQTGKSTLLQQFPADLLLSFVVPAVRQRYEKDPSLLLGEAEAVARGTRQGAPLIMLDEVQKVPPILDVVQDLIDRKVAQFVLTGSSARKLRRGSNVNLLPGRLVTMRLDPFVREEFPQEIERALIDGSLPGIVQEGRPEDREADLKSYVETYLEEEVRAEAIVRNVGAFARFLEFVGLESGNIVSFRALSQELGISHTTIASYFEILEDCLIVERIDPVTESRTRKKLTKSSRYLVFDLGVRRLCAAEGAVPSRDRLGALFEQYVGLELVRHARILGKQIKIRFWRDPDGPEVDWVIEKERAYLPVEVKWTDRPTLRDAKGLQVFLDEYKTAKSGFVICRVPRPVSLSPRITAFPWQRLHEILID